MNKIWIIIKREYLTRVKKRSFLIMTILGPVLMAAMFIVPAWLSQVEDNEVKIIAVIDSSKIFTGALPETGYIKFQYLTNVKISDIENNFGTNKYYALLFIPPSVLSSPIVSLSSNKQPSLAVRMHIANSLKRDIESLKLLKSNIDPKVLKSIETNVNVSVTKLNDDGTREQKSADLQMILGIVGGMLIYFFIFMYGSQVMRGVIEEKISRIVEVIISSVKPFQLMMGKIVGIAFVGITQFFLWIVFTFTIVTIAQSIFFANTPSYKEIKSQSIMSENKDNKVINQKQFNEISYNEVDAVFDSIKSIDFTVVIASFIFFFLGGYLLYSSMFAAIGSAVDNEADTQQFMMPITIPLILSIVLIGNVTSNPEGSIAFWFSIIPFTSPVVMMMRIPFGVPWNEVILSVTLLIGSFILMTWLAGKIYRTGILMYGKKVNYRELYKWIKYRNY
ncbi:MAG: ABC transporter permease [Bacteroidetes bacterium CG23_combo_of_CG06-09_8_20_14_all_32_9]|nr:MAG: ABC transporter permease [Bacteroidetes bacterium CG23_combo_of_CG06-09_8_20_14_all_32_9]